jgi:chorismate dehydratase
VPEDVKNVVGVSEAWYLRPLLYGLRDSAIGPQLLVDFPSQLALKLQQRTEGLRCALLSPIDYARHGGDYCIVPGVCASSATSSDTVRLFINPNARNIETLAVDIRVTSEIILAKIILAEKFANFSAKKGSPQFIPMLPHPGQMLQKADAALIINFHPEEHKANELFAIDLVDEWYDLTGLPYVHGIWVGHDEDESEKVAEQLVQAREQGVSHLGDIADALAAEYKLAKPASLEYLSRFSYDLGNAEQDALTEFMKYAYYHGVLPDVPDLNYFDIEAPPSPPVN